MGNSEFLSGKPASDKLIFVRISIKGWRFSPAVDTTYRGNLLLLLRCDQLLSIAPLEIKGLIESRNEVGANGFGFRLGDILVEPRQPTCHTPLDITPEGGALVGHDIGTTGIDDRHEGIGFRNVMGKDSAETVLMTAALSVVAEHLVGGLSLQDLLLIE